MGEEKVGHYVKYNMFHKEKSKKWQKNVTRVRNWYYVEERDEYICGYGRCLSFLHEKKQKSDKGYESLNRVYECESCSDSPHREKCVKGKASDADRRIYSNRRLNELKDALKDELRRDIVSDVEKTFLEAISSMSASLAERLSIMNASWGERLSLMNTSWGERFALANASLEKRLSLAGASLAEKIDAAGASLEGRFSAMEAATDEHIAAVRRSLEERLSLMENVLGNSLSSMNVSLEERFSTASSSLEHPLSLMGDALEDHLASMNSSLESRLADLEEKMQQNLRQGRRRQIALESLLDNKNKTLELLGNAKVSPSLEAVMALAENFALTRLAEPETPTSAILYGKLLNLMTCFDLSLIAEVGVPFDPEKHEACGTNLDSSHPENVVLEVVRPGFFLKDAVLRYATVVVNRFAEDEFHETSEEGILSDEGSLVNEESLVDEKHLADEENLA